jgi:chloramphenicol O-acetyltransferase
MGAVRIPHAAVDNLGINLFLDEVERRLGPMNVIPCNYFERITR